MNIKLSLKLFKFNCKLDYLPYYEKVNILVNKNDIMFDILKKIDNYNIEKNKFAFKINNIFIWSDLEIGEIVDRFGNDLIIEPISKKRVLFDLIIDKNDFDKKLLVLQEFLTQEDIENYQNYITYYYASPILENNDEFLGDGVFLIASKIIERDHGVKNQIYSIISDEDNGIWYSVNNCEKFFSKNENIYNEIEDLKNDIIKLSFIRNSITSGIKNYRLSKEEKIANEIYQMSIIFLKYGFAKEYDKDEDDFKSGFYKFLENIDFDMTMKEKKVSFRDFKIAIFIGNDYCTLKESANIDLFYKNLILNIDAQFIELDSKYDFYGKETKYFTQDDGLKACGKILLEAKDLGCDMILTDNVEAFGFFDCRQKKIEQICGREIGLPIVNSLQLLELAMGVSNSINLGFFKHKVKPSFV